MKRRLLAQINRRSFNVLSNVVVYSVRSTYDTIEMVCRKNSAVLLKNSVHSPRLNITFILISGTVLNRRFNNLVLVSNELRVEC